MQDPEIKTWLRLYVRTQLSWANDCQFYRRACDDDGSMPDAWLIIDVPYEWELCFCVWRTRGWWFLEINLECEPCMGSGKERPSSVARIHNTSLQWAGSKQNQTMRDTTTHRCFVTPNSLFISAKSHPTALFTLKRLWRLFCYITLINRANNGRQFPVHLRPKRNYKKKKISIRP